MRIVDAHHHLWDPRALDYTLLNEHGKLAPLAKPFLAGTFDAVAEKNGITDAIAVEATSAGADPAAETRWLLDQVGHSKVTRRVVVWAPIERPAVGGYLDALLSAGGSRIVGVRRSFEFVDPGFASSKEVIAGIRAVAARGLVFDLVLFAERLPEVTALVRQVPEAAFVLDHLGKPPVSDTVPDAWKRDLAALAKLPNVAAKVSGLVTEAVTTAWNGDMLRPYIDHAAASFGWDRLMFASDWPVCELAGGYRRWLETTMAAVDGATKAEQAAFVHATADRVYRRTG